MYFWHCMILVAVSYCIVYINSALYFNLTEFFWTLYVNSGVLNQPLSVSTVHCLMCTLDIVFFIFTFVFIILICVCTCSAIVIAFY